MKNMQSTVIQLPKILPVTSHTDFVGQDSTFVVIKGMKTHGVHFIPLAVERGATTIVIEKETLLSHEIRELFQKKHIELITVDNSRKALAQLSAAAFNNPAQHLKIVGITGTKGKTTSAFLLEHCLKNAGIKTALLSTVHNKIIDQIFPTTLTTQHPDYLHMFFNECVTAGVEYVAMEVAAQAYNLSRVEGIAFDGFLFTNFDQEHAEFYTTMDDYFHAKQALLLQTKKDAPCVINADSSRCAQLLQNHFYISFAQQASAQYRLSVETCSAHAMKVTFHSSETNRLTLPLIGEFNCYNALGVFALAQQLIGSTQQLINALESFTHVPGRLERYKLANGAYCFIDFAHNPSSYEAVLSTIRPLTQHLIVVCGAGGDRDKTKRPHMAHKATQYADFVIFTSDNPRTENPYAIIEDLLAGVALENKTKYYIELDRQKAIEVAYHNSTKDSIILLLGKGPDHYQIIGTEKIYFNESEIIQHLV